MRIRPRGDPVLFLSLEPVLRCPTRGCHKMAYGIMADLLTITCASCGARWWATRIEAGDIRAQIRAAFDGDELFVTLLDRLGAPERVDRPMFWQIPISGDEQYQFTDNRQARGLLIGTRALIRRRLGGPPRPQAGAA